MRISFSAYAAIVVTLVLCQCTKGENECVFQPDVKETASVNFESLAEDIANIKTKEQLVIMLGKHTTLRDQLLGRATYPDDSTFINTLFARFSHPGFDSLLLETNRIFGDEAALRNEFAKAFTNIQYYYPDFTPPKIETAITGLASDIVVTDSVIVIGLDYYLGKEGKYRPRLYDYLLTRYEPEDIVPSCMLIMGIGESVNKTNVEDHTALADMVAYGKSFYFAKHMLPCTPDSVFIWYSSDEIKGAKENEHVIWARLVEDEVLYSKSHEKKKKYLDDRPKTLEVGEKCPGRIAQWVGWQVVKKYMESHPETTLPQLMQQADAQALFRESHYKPN